MHAMIRLYDYEAMGLKRLSALKGLKTVPGQAQGRINDLKKGGK